MQNLRQALPSYSCDAFHTTYWTAKRNLLPSCGRAILVQCSSPSPLCTPDTVSDCMCIYQRKDAYGDNLCVGNPHIPQSISGQQWPFRDPCADAQDEDGASRACFLSRRGSHLQRSHKFLIKKSADVFMDFQHIHSTGLHCTCGRPQHAFHGLLSFKFAIMTVAFAHSSTAHPGSLELYWDIN